jgi:hypothetical protein
MMHRGDFLFLNPSVIDRKKYIETDYYFTVGHMVFIRNTLNNDAKSKGCSLFLCMDDGLSYCIFLLGQGCIEGTGMGAGCKWRFLR